MSELDTGRDVTVWPRLEKGEDAGIDLKALPAGATFLRLLGVNYVHVRLDDGGDLYLTYHGVPFYEHLRPENWYEAEWLRSRRQRLAGSGTVYRVPTKPVDRHAVRSIDLAIKWSRVGQDVPLDTFTLNRNLNAEFNTPFEEFSLVEELRRGEYGPPDVRIRTQKPLAIYVPSERLQLWQTGRSRERIMTRITRRPGVEIDILRSYIMIYGWIDGMDAPEAYARAYDLLPPEQRDAALAALTNEVEADLRAKGFMVPDHKPTHVIVRLRNNSLRVRRKRVVYGIVDYELLARTPDHEDAVKRAARSDYLVRQRDRFVPRPRASFPPNLQPARVLGVDYVYGHCESTGGVIWVVGRDPELFSYFLPERWRRKDVALSDTGQTYYVQTKDRIHLVWQVSRIGEVPPSELLDERFERMRQLGYNSPFEKVSYALEMARRGLPVVFPRAIYMTGKTGAPDEAEDLRRYDSMRTILTPDHLPAMPREHDYITLFGYWRGRDDTEAVEDLMLWNPIDLAAAAAKGLITPEQAAELLERHRLAMLKAGFQDLNLKADHVLMSYVPDGPIKVDGQGQVELRQCNFDLVKKVDPIGDWVAGEGG